MSTLTESIAAGLSVATAATIEPVTLAEAKLHLRVDHSVDDDYIEDELIIAARQYVELHCRRTLMKTTYRLTLDRFPSDSRGGVIRLPNPPLLSVSSITYIDNAGDSQTVTSTDYRVDVYKEPGEIEPAYGKTWPSTRTLTGAVTVNYVAGYSDSSTPATARLAVPACLRQAVKLVIEDMYRSRGTNVIGGNVNKLDTLDAVLAPAMWGGYS